jgi:hypothetical protein
MEVEEGVQAQLLLEALVVQLALSRLLLTHCLLPRSAV